MIDEPIHTINGQSFNWNLGYNLGFKEQNCFAPRPCVRGEFPLLESNPYDIDTLEYVEYVQGYKEGQIEGSYDYQLQLAEYLNIKDRSID